MEVQTIATMYIERNDDGSMKARHRRGEFFELGADKAKTAIADGFVRKAGDDSELPAPNFAAVDPRPTQPDGTPISEDADGKELVAGPAAPLTADDGWKAPTTHKAADAQLSDYNISMPSKATVAQKVQAIEAYRAAQASAQGAPTQPTTQDLSELDDQALVEMGIDAGLTEDELVELDHDALVLRVAEVVNLRTHGDASLESNLGADPNLGADQG